MADQIIRHAHNEVVTRGGQTGRFMLPPDPKLGGAYDRIIGDRLIQFFELKVGATCKDDRPDSKERAMVVFDRDPATSHGPGIRLRTTYAVEFLPGAPISSDWFGGDQHNSWGPPWRPPPASINLGIVSKQECFLFFARGDGVDDSKPVAPPFPFQRGRRYQIERDFVMGQGKPGLLRVKIDGKVVCDYGGVTGWLDSGKVYAAYGLYRARPKAPVESIAAKFENWRESVVSAGG